QFLERTLAYRSVLHERQRLYRHHSSFAQDLDQQHVSDSHCAKLPQHSFKPSRKRRARPLRFCRQLSSSSRLSSSGVFSSSRLIAWISGCVTSPFGLRGALGG